MAKCLILSRLGKEKIYFRIGSFGMVSLKAMSGNVYVKLTKIKVNDIEKYVQENILLCLLFSTQTWGDYVGWGDNILNLLILPVFLILNG